MNRREFWITAVAFAAIVAVSVLAYRRVARAPADLCQVCQRSLHAGVTYHLEMADGTREAACCPRCGMHLQVERPGLVRRAWATDLATSEEIPAATAVYVEGGDVEYCTMHEAPVRRAPEGVAARDYDRCLPTLVAFKIRGEAEQYQAQHGGRVLEGMQAMESVKQR